jgi:succinate dehydrogenase / fumarate reductase cytochrome b subunit
LGEAPFALVNTVFGWWPAQAVLFLATWALFHHMLGGIRHFVWDTGRALSPSGREWIVRFQLLGSILLTLGVWALFVWFK